MKRAYGIRINVECFEESIDHALQVFEQDGWDTSYSIIDMRPKAERSEPLGTHLVITGTSPDHQPDPQGRNIATHVTMLGEYVVRTGCEM